MPKKPEIVQWWECPLCNFTYESYVKVSGVGCPTQHHRKKGKLVSTKVWLKETPQPDKPTRGVRLIPRPTG